jgi:hypothetical protein
MNFDDYVYDVKSNDYVEREEQKDNGMSEKLGMIQVKRLEENEDGSANLEIVTDVEATRLLVEVGLTRLLEMALDKENEEYGIEGDLLKASKVDSKEETRESAEALPEDDRTDTGEQG